MRYYLTEPKVIGDTTRIVAGGELDMWAAPALRDALARALEACLPHVVVDLTDATFVDSTTIGTLLAASKHLREAGSRLQLRCTNRNVLRTFEIAGLERHISVSREPDPSQQVVVPSTG
jgi:anti-sigma B factor antagonist